MNTFWGDHKGEIKVTGAGEMRDLDEKRMKPDQIPDEKARGRKEESLTGVKSFSGSF